MTNTDKVRLGAHGPEVFPLALGCMGMGGASFYGDSSDAESIATIHAALERGVNLLDTGDFYGTGRNELLVGRALAGRRDQALVSVKFGALRGPDGRVCAFVAVMLDDTDRRHAECEKGRLEDCMSAAISHEAAGAKEDKAHWVEVGRSYERFALQPTAPPQRPAAAVWRAARAGPPDARSGPRVEAAPRSRRPWRNP